MNDKTETSRHTGRPEPVEGWKTVGQIVEKAMEGIRPARPSFRRPLHPFTYRRTRAEQPR